LGIMRVGVVLVVMYIKEARNWCWFHSPTHTLKMMKSQYIIAGILLTLPTLLLTTFSTDYCLKGKVYNVVLRRTFYSSQLF